MTHLRCHVAAWLLRLTMAGHGRLWRVEMGR
jgi:hypothetical protein